MIKKCGGWSEKYEKGNDITQLKNLCTITTIKYTPHISLYIGPY